MSLGGEAQRVVAVWVGRGRRGHIRVGLQVAPHHVNRLLIELGRLTGLRLPKGRVGSRDKVRGPSPTGRHRSDRKDTLLSQSQVAYNVHKDAAAPDSKMEVHTTVLQPCARTAFCGFATRDGVRKVARVSRATFAPCATPP